MSPLLKSRMTSMHIEAISTGASAHHNEDWAGSFVRGDTSDLVILDGATSVAGRDYIDLANGDVRWFVTRFALALETAITAGLAQAQAVHAAAETVERAFRAAGAADEMPVYAWPIAALSWVRIRDGDAGHRLELYCLGDCKVLLRTRNGAVRDLDPFVNPQEGVVKAEIARLQAEGVSDPAARLERMMPMLRARRVEQSTAVHTNALCLRPKGAFGARTAAFDAPPGSAVLAMTDGFYRLVDTYGLHTPSSLFDLCIERGLEAAVTDLRSHEAAARAAAPLAVKRADDASAILWRAPLPHF